jgi:hypothetical protein
VPFGAGVAIGQVNGSLFDLHGTGRVTWDDDLLRQRAAEPGREPPHQHLGRDRPDRRRVLGTWSASSEPRPDPGRGLFFSVTHSAATRPSDLRPAPTPGPPPPPCGGRPRKQTSPAGPPARIQRDGGQVW